MGHRAYGEPKSTKENPLLTFIGGFVWGFIAFPVTMGWALPVYQIADWPATLMIGGILGLYMGGDMAWSSMKRLRDKRNERG